jgi:hypothetical protein
MTNTWPAGRMRPVARTPAARTQNTEIWSCNGQHCSYHNLNWINVRRSQKNSMFFIIQNVFYTWKYDRLFPSVKSILTKENILYVRYVKHAARGPYVVCGPHDNTNVTHMALGGTLSLTCLVYVTSFTHSKPPLTQLSRPPVGFIP